MDDLEEFKDPVKFFETLFNIKLNDYQKFLLKNPGKKLIMVRPRRL